MNRSASTTSGTFIVNTTEMRKRRDFLKGTLKAGGNPDTRSRSPYVPALPSSVSKHPAMQTLQAQAPSSQKPNSGSEARPTAPQKPRPRATIGVALRSVPLPVRLPSVACVPSSATGSPNGHPRSPVGAQVKPLKLNSQPGKGVVTPNSNRATTQLRSARTPTSSQTTPKTPPLPRIPSTPTSRTTSLRTPNSSANPSAATSRAATPQSTLPRLVPTQTAAVASRPQTANGSRPLPSSAPRAVGGIRIPQRKKPSAPTSSTTTPQRGPAADASYPTHPSPSVRTGKRQLSTATGSARKVVVSTSPPLRSTARSSVRPKNLLKGGGDLASLQPLGKTRYSPEKTPASPRGTLNQKASAVNEAQRSSLGKRKQPATPTVPNKTAKQSTPSERRVAKGQQLDRHLREVNHRKNDEQTRSQDDANGRQLSEVGSRRGRQARYRERRRGRDRDCGRNCDRDLGRDPGRDQRRSSNQDVERVQPAIAPKHRRDEHAAKDEEDGQRAKRRKPISMGSSDEDDDEPRGKVRTETLREGEGSRRRKMKKNLEEEDDKTRSRSKKKSLEIKAVEEEAEEPRKRKRASGHHEVEEGRPQKKRQPKPSSSSPIRSAEKNAAALTLPGAKEDELRIERQSKSSIDSSSPRASGAALRGFPSPSRAEDDEDDEMVKPKAARKKGYRSSKDSPGMRLLMARHLKVPSDADDGDYGFGDILAGLEIEGVKPRENVTCVKKAKMLQSHGAGTTGEVGQAGEAQKEKKTVKQEKALVECEASTPPGGDVVGNGPITIRDEEEAPDFAEGESDEDVPGRKEPRRAPADGQKKIYGDTPAVNQVQGLFNVVTKTRKATRDEPGKKEAITFKTLLRSGPVEEVVKSGRGRVSIPTASSAKGSEDGAGAKDAQDIKTEPRLRTGVKPHDNTSPGGTPGAKSKASTAQGRGDERDRRNCDGEALMKEIFGDEEESPLSHKAGGRAIVKKEGEVDEALPGRMTRSARARSSRAKMVRADGSLAVAQSKRTRHLETLSKEEGEAVDWILHGDDKEVISEVARSGLKLQRGDVKCLLGERWLNDEVINVYVTLINRRNAALVGSGEARAKGVPNTYVFNTFFFSRLRGPAGYDYAGVARWTRRAGVDVRKLDQVLVPVNLGNNHWVLAAVDMRKREFLYLDSLRGGDSHRVVATLRRWLKDELRDKHGADACARMGVDRWKTLYHRYYVRRHVPFAGCARNADVAAPLGRAAPIPLQSDGGSCGVFAAKMADCIALGVRMFFSQRDMPLVRARMALELADLALTT